MKRYRGLFRDTWWLWLLMVGAGVIAAQFSPVFYSSIPISFFSFLYFGFVRYDEDGNQIEGS
jgi:hypothetical protein